MHQLRDFQISDAEDYANTFWNYLLSRNYGFLDRTLIGNWQADFWSQAYEVLCHPGSCIRDSLFDLITRYEVVC